MSKSIARFLMLLIGGGVIFCVGVYFEKGKKSQDSKELELSSISELQGENFVPNNFTLSGVPAVSPEPTASDYATLRDDLIGKINKLLVLGAGSYGEIEALGRWEAQQDFDAVLRALSSDDIEWDLVAKERFVKGVWGIVIHQGWDSVEQLTETDPQLMSRLDLDSMVPGIFAKNDPDRAIKYAKTYLKGSDYHDALAEAVMEIANSDIEKAKDYMADMAPGTARERVASSLASKIAKGDIALGLEWASALPTAEDRKVAMSRIATEWGHRDPKGAADYLSDIAKSPERDYMIHQVAAQWARYDGKAAIDWINEDDPKNSRARMGALQVWASFDTEKALKYVAENFDGGKNSLISQGEAFNVYLSGIQKDPEVSAASVSLIEDESLRAILSQQIVRRWMRLDPIAASAWVDRLKPGKAKDKSIEKVIYGTSDSLEKLIWAAEIGDKKMRTKSFRVIGSQILANEKLMDQAAEELSESQLSDFLEAVGNLKPEER